MKRSTALLIAAATAAAAITINASSSASASGDNRGSTVRFKESTNMTIALAQAESNADLSRCQFDPGASAPKTPCVGPVTHGDASDATYSGDIVGSNRGADTVSLMEINDPATLNEAVVFMFPVTARVSHCGSGNFVLQVDGNFSQPTSTWKVIPGSGRGDLVGLEGSGTGAGGFDGPGGTFEGSFVGRVHCHAWRLEPNVWSRVELAPPW